MTQPADGSDSDTPEQGPPPRRPVDRRRLDEVFGDTLPATTDDEREPGEHSGFDAEHYRRNRPPHHTA